MRSWICCFFLYGEGCLCEIMKVEKFNYEKRNISKSPIEGLLLLFAVCWTKPGICFSFIIRWRDVCVCVRALDDYLSPPVLVLNAMTHSSPQDFKTVHNNSFPLSKSARN